MSEQTVAEPKNTAKAETRAEPESASAKEAKARKSLDEKIEEAEAELKRLKEAKRRKEEEDRKRNEAELRALLASEKLNLTPAAVWRKALPAIKTALERAGA